jgi:rod shape determining protein RodA
LRYKVVNSLKLTSEETFLHKILSLNWILLVLIFTMACVGFLSLYSAAGGNLEPWASKQIMRFCVGVVGLFIVALIHVRWWFQLSYPIYIVGFVLLIVVEVMGHTGMGAQRWINLGFIQLQPSEFMKIAVVMALARYFHSASVDDMKSVKFLLPAVFLVLAPVALVLLQPDLGTSIMIVLAGISLFFLAGAPIWMFITGGIAVLSALPVIWHFMKDYQKARVQTFLDPESDPLGAGYHITQSKIALGSGGIDGKGFLEGTQSRLNFLPEKQTDFIFTLWAEEWGLFGGIFLLVLVSLIILCCINIAYRSRHFYCKLMAYGLTVNFFLYVFINIAMVMGLIPVVGAPLPLISYGGTSMLAVLTGFGLILSCQIHREGKLIRT